LIASLIWRTFHSLFSSVALVSKLLDRVLDLVVQLFYMYGDSVLELLTTGLPREQPVEYV
jgi:hypothetical protein